MKRVRAVVLSLLAATLVHGIPVAGTGNPQNKKGGLRASGRRTGSIVLPPEVAALQELSVVLGRPTDREVTLNVLADNTLEGLVEYGPAAGRYERRTGTFRVPAGTPVEITLDELQPNTAYAYRLSLRKRGEADFTVGEEHRFHTRRAPGSTFTFDIQGDSHPERSSQFDPVLYSQTLRSAATDCPDFYMTIGDDFSVDTLRTVTPEAISGIYRNQRLFLGLIGRAAPIFLVNGNHEQAAAYNLDASPDNVAVWAQTARNKFFAQPVPDLFYSGDEQPVEFIGPLRDYYSWTWGDALFVIIDFYWHSPGPVDNIFGGGAKSRDMWAITLGDAQYQWLQRTLEESRARYKFVFSHHVLGTGRGGIEEADFYEWGGYARNGAMQFDRMRRGWGLPIHQLFVKNGVTIFFQGHDHLFARQELDGVVYQTLPEPADPGYTLYNSEAYLSGNIVPNSGRVRVTVSPEKVHVDYVRSYLPKDATEEHPDGEIAFHYEIPASGMIP